VNCSRPVESEWRSLVSVGSMHAMNFTCAATINPPESYRDMQTQALFVIVGKVCFKSL
jgi:hypothetical protein